MSLSPGRKTCSVHALAEGRLYSYIHAIVTHPGTQGAGGALIECAVNLSHGGIIRLAAAGSANAAYMALGFSPISVPGTIGHMELIPTESDAWTRIDGSWRLAMHADRRYVHDAIALRHSMP